MVFRDIQNPLASLKSMKQKGMANLCQLHEPYVASATLRSVSLKVPQTVCSMHCFMCLQLKP